MTALAFAWRLAWRELRGGLRGFYIFLGCLALGVAAIAGVGSLSAGIEETLNRDGRAMLGGDIELRLIHREASPQELDYFSARGRFSEAVNMRAMAHAGEARTLVELKGVDAAYPLVGTMTLDPPIPLADALKDGGAVAEDAALVRLGLKLGDRINIGNASFVLRARILREPDRTAEGLTLGPRIMVSRAALEQTGLINPGSLIYYHYRLVLAPGGNDQKFIADLNEAMPDAGWRVRDWRNANPGLKQFIDRVGLFLVLVGLTALLVGGVGVGNATAAYLDAKISTIATLKCLGATRADIFRVYLIQIGLLTLFGIALGLVVGAAIPPLLVKAFGDLLPLSVTQGIYPAPLAFALLYGFLIALAFALWPLARTAEVTPAGLFRDLVAPETRVPLGALVGIIVCLGIAAAIAVITTEDRLFALWFVGGAIATFGVLRLVAAGIAALARRAGRPRSTAWRLALTSLYRPGAATASVVLSLGLGLTLLVAIVLLQGNLDRQIAERLPNEAPSFFFVDIQPDQIKDFDQTIRAIPGAGELRAVPSLRGRITRVNDVPADQVKADPRERWVLRGDRGLTYAATLPNNNEIIAGQWWPADYKGPPLLSLEADAARGIGVGIGDTLTVNILGRDITATVASLRKLDWSSFALNFALIYSPGLLEAAPHTYLATVRADPRAEEVVFKTITDRFANVSAIRVKDALDQATLLLGAISAAIRAAAGVTLVSGLLVLGGAIAAGHRRRVREAVILKVLGATRADVARAYLAEYLLLGLVTTVIAGLLGMIVAWAVLTLVMKAPFVVLPGLVTLTAAGGSLATALFGLVATWMALSARPAPVLRHI